MQCTVPVCVQSVPFAPSPQDLLQAPEAASSGGGASSGGVCIDVAAAAGDAASAATAALAPLPPAAEAALARPQEALRKELAAAVGPDVNTVEARGRERGRSRPCCACVVRHLLRRTPRGVPCPTP